ncbi:type II secretion system F family protein [Caldimonas tepidiphila]|uniref:type II secretion system F family protein n=1 Tax=Caldimonas tepidiphila TaxID=2315841 RepID=UPI000E5AADBF|nr:type II secretion system F family protein [Caldimonas tepidiphila]
MRFHVRGLKGAREVAALTIDAADAQDAAHQAREQGVSVVSVRAERTPLRLPGASRRFPLLLFAQELVALLDAGLNAVEALEMLSERGAGGAPQPVLRRLRAALQDGHTFSQALERMPELFPPLFVAAVRASERTGDLREALARYIDYQVQVEQARQKLVNATIYPALLLGVGALVAVFMLVYVVPRFSLVYAGLGQDLPLLSRLLLGLGEGLRDHALPLAALLLAGAAAAVQALRRPPLRQWLLTRLLWRLPGVGERARLHQLGRFYRTMGMLLRSGIPVASATEMAAGLLTPSLRPALQHATRQLREGQALSVALERNGLATPVARGLLQVGERSGRIGEMMEHAATLCENEIARWIERFTRLFEPLLMAVIGLAVGVIVLLLYLPVFELAGSIR